MTETFHGYIDTTQDVLLIFEGCRRGLLPKVNRRLHDRERRLIESGSVFVFDERESGVKRWTDGIAWSPSRILGNFLVYRELEKKHGDGGKRGSLDHRQRSRSLDMNATLSRGAQVTERAKEKRLVGSLSEAYHFRADGLVKKTMSIVVNGSTQHLISYYHPQDVIDHKLRTPSSVPELASLEIAPDLLIKQNFRIPPFVEPTAQEAARAAASAMASAGASSSPSSSSSPMPSPSLAMMTATSQQPPRSASMSAMHQNFQRDAMPLPSFYYASSMPPPPPMPTSTMAPNNLHETAIYTQDNKPLHLQMSSSPIPTSSPAPNALHNSQLSPPARFHTPTPPNPQLGHLLNPVHTINIRPPHEFQSNASHQPHDMIGVKMEHHASHPCAVPQGSRLL
ncbi:Gti1/Pac2 family-domain-containing protein [Gongronella butleri]|nr:Gti1/Pac2 family-domain-containing protein [Gongronella butleri]